MAIRSIVFCEECSETLTLENKNTEPLKSWFSTMPAGEKGILIEPGIVEGAEVEHCCSWMHATTNAYGRINNTKRKAKPAPPVTEKLRKDGTKSLDY